MQYLIVYLFLAPLLIAGFFAWRQLLSPGVRHWANYRMLALAILPGVGLFAPNIWIYYAVLLACMIFVPRSRVEAVGLYILLALMLPLSQFWLTAGSALLFSVSAISVMSLGLLTSLRFKTDGERTVSKWNEFDTVFFAMWLLIVVIDVRNGDITTVSVFRHTITSACFLGIPYWVISRTPITKIDSRRLLHYVAMAGFILSLDALFELLRSWPLYAPIDTNLGTSFGLSKTTLQRGGLQRATGPYVESTTFGIILAISAIVIFAQRSIFRSPLAHSIAVAVCCAGCFAALGRSGWLGMIVGLLMASIFSGRIGMLAALIFTGATGGLAAFLLAADSTLGGNLIGITGHAADTVEYREILFEKSWLIIERSPLLGENLKNVLSVLGSDLTSGGLAVDFVNSYLYFSIFFGIIGFSLFTLYVLFPAIKMAILRKSVLADGCNEEFATALFACSIAFATVMMFTSFYERLPFMSMLLIAGARQLKVRHLVEGRIRPDSPVRRAWSRHQPLNSFR